jgi:hypothetical protein
MFRLMPHRQAAHDVVVCSCSFSLLTTGYRTEFSSVNFIQEYSTPSLYRTKKTSLPLTECGRSLVCCEILTVFRNSHGLYSEETSKQLELSNTDSISRIDRKFKVKHRIVPYYNQQDTPVISNYLFL